MPERVHIGKVRSPTIAGRSGGVGENIHLITFAKFWDIFFIGGVSPVG